MSTKVYYPQPLTEKQILNNFNKSNENEIKWLISNVLLTELPSLRDELKNCVDKISDSNDFEVRLPLTSHNSEILKGIITRQNFKITGLNITVKNIKVLNNGKSFKLQLKQGKEIIIKQLIDCHDSINNAINMIDKITATYENTEEANTIISPNITLSYVSKLLNNIASALKSLKSPFPFYIFPVYRLPAAFFEPELPANVSLDIFISNSELGIDFKSLTPVVNRPWSLIVDKNNRRSFADIVRDTISKERNKTIPRILIDEYNNLLEWQKELKEKHEDLSNLAAVSSSSASLLSSSPSPASPPPESSGIASMFSSIFSSNNNPSASTLLKTASKYLEESITYVNNNNDPVVVLVNQTCDVVSSDPVLLTISIKLDSLKKTCEKIQENFESVLNSS
ncbi:unnamed protein product [[Candida] boidinii]|nr:unnamed protein product [[Candida] boidinii]